MREGEIPVFYGEITNEGRVKKRKFFHASFCL